MKICISYRLEKDREKHRKIVMQKYIWVCSALLLTVLAGCGNGGTKVTGKVTYGDGTPLTVGRVMFENDTISASGPIDQEGKYQLTVDESRTGLPAGSYRVCILGAMQSDPSMAGKIKKDKHSADDEEGAPVVLVIDPKFTSGTNSGLTCDVQGSSVTYDITVEKPAKGYKPFSND